MSYYIPSLTLDANLMCGVVITLCINLKCLEWLKGVTDVKQQLPVQFVHSLCLGRNWELENCLHLNQIFHDKF